MGYDFMFMRLNEPESHSFPLGCDQLVEADGEGLLPWDIFRAWLIAKGGRENGGEDSIWVDYPDGGSINFNGKEDSVYLDTHSHWQYVLEAYRALVALERNSSIFDLQSGEYHNEPSFKRKIQESYGGEPAS